MKIKQLLQNDLKRAMLDQDDLHKRTLRMVIASLKLAEVDHKAELDEPAILALIQKEVKSRQETIDEAKQAGRDDLVERTQAEIEVLQEYLPQALSENELKDLVQETIDEVGAEGPADMGKVMKAIMPRSQGRADGKMVSELVRGKLSAS
ncbi:MAG: GatB/YqeY domain-containing protein [Anaerolineales bacterium]